MLQHHARSALKSPALLLYMVIHSNGYSMFCNITCWYCSVPFITSERCTILYYIKSGNKKSNTVKMWRCGPVDSTVCCSDVHCTCAQCTVHMCVHSVHSAQWRKVERGHSRHLKRGHLDSEHAPDSSRCFPFKILRIFAPAASKSGKKVCFVKDRTAQQWHWRGRLRRHRDWISKILQQLVIDWTLRPNQFSKFKNGFEFSGGRYKRHGREMGGTRWSPSVSYYFVARVYKVAPIWELLAQE